MISASFFKDSLEGLMQSRTFWRNKHPDSCQIFHSDLVQFKWQTSECRLPPYYILNSRNSLFPNVCSIFTLVNWRVAKFNWHQISDTRILPRPRVSWHILPPTPVCDYRSGLKPAGVLQSNAPIYNLSIVSHLASSNCRLILLSSGETAAGGPVPLWIMKAAGYCARPQEKKKKNHFIHFFSVDVNLTRLDLQITCRATVAKWNTCVLLLSEWDVQREVDIQASPTALWRLDSGRRSAERWRRTVT